MNRDVAVGQRLAHWPVWVGTADLRARCPSRGGGDAIRACLMSRVSGVLDAGAHGLARRNEATEVVAVHLGGRGIQPGEPRTVRRSGGLVIDDQAERLRSEVAWADALGRSVRHGDVEGAALHIGGAVMIVCAQAEATPPIAGRTGAVASVQLRPAG